MFSAEQAHGDGSRFSVFLPCGARYWCRQRVSLSRTCSCLFDINNECVSNCTSNILPAPDKADFQISGVNRTGTGIAGLSPCFLFQKIVASKPDALGPARWFSGWGLWQPCQITAGKEKADSRRLPSDPLTSAHLQYVSMYTALIDICRSNK